MMNLWGSPNPFLAHDAANRPRQTEDLVAEVATALGAAGEYVARIDLRPTQRVVDFNWAAHQAGRRLAIRVKVDLTITNSGDGKAEVRVSAVEPLR